MSVATKRALAESFRKLLTMRSFDKITVKDIVEECGVNRQTFYYHFHDVYDLIDWIFRDAADALAAQPLDYTDWAKGLECLLNYMKEDRVLILNTYSSISHEVVSDYIRRHLRPYCVAFVRCQAELDNETAPQEDLEFVAEIFTLTATGLVEQWLGSKMRVNEPMLRSLEKLKIAMTGSSQLMLRNLKENSRTQEAL